MTAPHDARNGPARLAAPRVQWETARLKNQARSWRLGRPTGSRETPLEPARSKGFPAQAGSRRRAVVCSALKGAQAPDFHRVCGTGKWWRGLCCSGPPQPPLRVGRGPLAFAITRAGDPMRARWWWCGHVPGRLGVAGRAGGLYMRQQARAHPVIKVRP